MSGLSAFRQKKIAHEFRLLDLNGDGHLGKEDFQLAAARLGAAMGWGASEPKLAALIERRESEWDEICLASDFDGSNTVDPEEYLRFYAQVTRGLTPQIETIPGWYRKVCATRVDCIDLDEDGLVTLEEYRRFMTAHGRNDFDIEACFNHLDLKQTGHLDHEECVVLCLQFYLGEDPALPGNSLWGPLPN